MIRLHFSCTRWNGKVVIIPTSLKYITCRETGVKTRAFSTSSLDQCVCSYPVLCTVCLTLVFPPLCLFSLPHSIFSLVSAIFAPLFPLSSSVSSRVSSVAQTWKIFTTVSIDTWSLQRTNALAISPQHLWVPSQPRRRPALCAAPQACSPSAASRSVSCPLPEERRPSRGSRYVINSDVG